MIHYDINIRPKHGLFEIILVDGINRIELGTHHGDITHAHAFIWGMVHGLGNFNEFAEYSISDLLDAPTKITMEY